MDDVMRQIKIKDDEKQSILQFKKESLDKD